MRRDFIFLWVNEQKTTNDEWKLVFNQTLPIVLFSTRPKATIGESPSEPHANTCMYTCMNNQWTTSPLKNRPRCYAKSPTAQDTFRPTPGIISCTGVTGMGTAISCTEHSHVIYTRISAICLMQAWILTVVFRAKMKQVWKLQIKEAVFSLCLCI